MKVIIYKGKYNTGKTITLRMLYCKILELPIVDDMYEYQYSKINKSEEHFTKHLEGFKRFTEYKVKALAFKGNDEDDFYAHFKIADKLLFLVSHSTNTEAFEIAFAKIKTFKPDLILFCVKEFQQPNTLYLNLQSFLAQVKPENYLEILTNKVKSEEIESEKNKKADKLLNIILRTLNGEKLSNLD